MEQIFKLLSPATEVKVDLRRRMKLKFKTAGLPDRRRQGRRRIASPASPRATASDTASTRAGRTEATASYAIDLEVERFRATRISPLPRRSCSKTSRPSSGGKAWPLSTKLTSKTSVCAVNLDIEMETGTGKTYCYIKTMFELNKRYGWSKFIVVVPSIAIREGVLQVLRDHGRSFSGALQQDARAPSSTTPRSCTIWKASPRTPGINVMIINVQAFNAPGKDARRIYEELDDFQSRQPIDVIAPTGRS